MRASTAEKRSITLADLAHVGPGTPTGEWLRRYWLAVGTSAELRDIPLGLKILGEELVLFRDLNGKIGLWNTATSKSAASAAPITAGSSTSQATV
jgi:hypothetical protein